MKTGKVLPISRKNLWNVLTCASFVVCKQSCINRSGVHLIASVSCARTIVPQLVVLWPKVAIQNVPLITNVRPHPLSFQPFEYQRSHQITKKKIETLFIFNTFNTFTLLSLVKFYFFMNLYIEKYLILIFIPVFHYIWWIILFYYYNTIALFCVYMQWSYLHTILVCFPSCLTVNFRSRKLDFRS